MQIVYNRRGMYVTFNSMLKLKETLTIPPWSDEIVEGVLKEHVWDGTNVMICGNTVNQFTTSSSGSTLIQSSLNESPLPVLLTNTKQTPVTLPKT